MRVFIGGVMQGSRRGKSITDQDYRQTIARVVKARHPSAEVVDPWELFPDSIDYDDDHARQVLSDIAEEAARADVVVAYLPEASMGTALEMVRACDAGTPVISISPMAENWFIRCFSQRVFPSLGTFTDWINTGGLDTVIASRGGESGVSQASV
jgi:hypothetical protein